MPKTEYLTAPLKTDKMPPGVPYIVGNEAAERFSYYGMNSILVIFMTSYMLNAQGQADHMNGPQAEAWYHTFVSCVYFLPLLGAFLADAILGKYRTILILSIVYCLGHFTLALEHTRIGLCIGLFLIAMGAGGIKPCVSANVGDQFGATNQHLLPKVFSWFYFSINIGSALSTLLIPWLLDPYQASPEFAAHWPTLSKLLERIHGPDVAFGTPGLLMLIATIIFWLGRKKFVHLPPTGLRRYVKEIRSRENLKALGNLLILVPFAAIFWGLWQQNFSSWVLQSEKMDRHLFGVDWKPAQIQTVNPLFILLMLPLFSYVVYPAMEKVFRVTPLRRIGIGLFVTAIAFSIIGWIQIRIDAGQTPHILWQILAFVALTVSEVMVSVTHLEFAYTQAPKKLKSLVMCTYLGAISLGNVFTAAVNFLIERKTINLEGAPYFFFFVKIMIVTALLFIFFAQFYRGKTYIQDEVESLGEQPAEAD
ncbi:MAG TPA: POT family MFS transporter [Candidatus Limnocylindrales bacterium]|nr:POT family MFS transporter [Candidatus Limnocylindrales bacterium]